MKGSELQSVVDRRTCVSARHFREQRPQATLLPVAIAPAQGQRPRWSKAAEVTLYVVHEVLEYGALGV